MQGEEWRCDHSPNYDPEMYTGYGAKVLTRDEQEKKTII